MSIPILNALFNFEINAKENKLFKRKKQNIENLQFLKVDKKRFPAMHLITKKNMSKSAPIIINAANEIFVDQFLKSKISFNSIYSYLSLVLKDKNYIKYANMKSSNIDKVLKIDKWARNVSMLIINKAKQKNV